MFKDDKMISFLTAIVLMVAVGTVIQKADLSSDDDGARGERVSDVVLLADDKVTLAVGTSAKLDVFANDRGLQPIQRTGLSVVRAPDCGGISVLGDALEYQAEPGCEGERRIVYTVPEAGAGITATVFISVIPRETSPDAAAQDVVAATAPVEPVLPAPIRKAEEPEVDQIVVASVQPVSEQTETQPSQPQAVALEAGLEPQGPDLGKPALRQPELKAENNIAAKPSTAPEPRAELAVMSVVEAQPAWDAQPDPIVAEPVTREAPRRLAALGQPLPRDPDLTVQAAKAGTSATAQFHKPQAQAQAIVAELPSHGAGIMLAVLAAEEPPTGNPDEPLGDQTTIEEAQPNLTRTARLGDGTIGLRALDALGSAEAPALGRPLGGLPVDQTQPPPARAPDDAPEPAPRAAVETTVARAEPPEASVPNQVAPAAPEGGADVQQAALPSTITQDCVIPPSTAIDVMRAARTRLSVAAPCHAGTVAELSYSGIRFAVPLNEQGLGEIMTLGFEANAQALLTFVDGQKIDFDLPFKGVNRVARVGLVWDVPVNLELNALEFGALLGTDRHVRPDNRRTFRDVRRTGGGFLHSFRSAGGVGQNTDVYSFYKRAGGTQGVVRMMIDFASRNREQLEGTCGDGALAAPQFLVIRSDGGQVERPILRRLAALDCSEVALETGDKRLISEGIADLLIQ